MKNRRFEHGLNYVEGAQSGQAVDFVNALKRAGVDVTFRMAPDHGHDVMNAVLIAEAIPFLSAF